MHTSLLPLEVGLYSTCSQEDSRICASHVSWVPTSPSSPIALLQPRDSSTSHGAFWTKPSFAHGHQVLPRRKGLVAGQTCLAPLRQVGPLVLLSWTRWGPARAYSVMHASASSGGPRRGRAQLLTPPSPPHTSSEFPSYT